MIFISLIDIRIRVILIIYIYIYIDNIYMNIILVNIIIEYQMTDKLGLMFLIVLNPPTMVTKL